MMVTWALAGLLALLLSGHPVSTQIEDPGASAQPPNLLLLVHQRFLPGKASARAKLEMAMSRACEKLDVPDAWIDLEAITGEPEALSFDPFDTFEQIDRAAAEWPKIYAKNPEVARLQEEITALVLSERTVIAVRRDDLGYRTNTIDLSKARVMRVLQVFVSGARTGLRASVQDPERGYERINSDTPWVVYQVNVGEPLPSFLAFVPMRSLSQNDDLIARRIDLLHVEGEDNAERMQQIARQAYASLESNLYVISPETSHVFKEFAAGSPEFWKIAPDAPPAAKKRE